MNEEQNKLIEEQFSTLPKSLQRAIAVSPWRVLIEEIAKSNSLTQEQSEALERETMFILYGFEPATDYIENIVRETSITREIAEKIADEAGNKIFEPIIDKEEELNKVQTNEDSTNSGNYMLPDNKPEEKTEITPAPHTELEIPPENHPQTIPNQTSHDNLPPEPQGPLNVIDEKGDLEKPQEPTEQNVPIRPATKYPEGADPYREPAE